MLGFHHLHGVQTSPQLLPNAQPLKKRVTEKNGPRGGEGGGGAHIFVGCLVSPGAQRNTVERRHHNKSTGKIYHLSTPQVTIQRALTKPYNYQAYVTFNHVMEPSITSYRSYDDSRYAVFLLFFPLR